jgi:hypothetical protein
MRQRSVLGGIEHGLGHARMEVRPSAGADLLDRDVQRHSAPVGRGGI